MVSTVTCGSSGAFGVLPRFNSHLKQTTLSPEGELIPKLYHKGQPVKLARVGAPQQAADFVCVT
jgi:hypothetical protein